MSESKFQTTSNKVSFLLGLCVGLAIIGLVGFFMTLPKALSCLESGNNKQVALTEKSTGQEQPAVQNNNAVNKPSEQPAVKPSGDATKLSPVKNSEYIKGDKNAKVTLIEFSDFQCPYCARHAETMTKVMQEYNGQVRLVFRHFPLSFHPEAQKAAEAAECAGEQGKFWEMHDKIFEANKNQQMSISTWKETAKTLELDTNKFNDCLDSGKYESKIKSDQAEGQAAGVKGTPATFVNGEMVSGAVPYDTFKTTIDKYLIVK